MSTPTPGPGLTEAQLEKIARGVALMPHGVGRLDRRAVHRDLTALVAALRAAWRERDEARADVETVARAMEVDAVGAEEIAAEAERQGALEGLAYWRGRRHGLRIGQERLARVRAALAAPGAGGQATEEQT